MNKEQILNISKTIIRLFVGVVFVGAAISKLLTIDHFEIYIYSFHIFGYGLTTVLSRMLIAAEILMGLGMIFKIYYKEIWSLTMLALIGFTLFLIYVIIFRNDDNCHCFGDLIRLDPKESIVKNVVSMLLLLLIRKENSHDYRPRLKKWLVGISIAVAIILPFVVFPMDTLYNMIASKDNNINTVEWESLQNDQKYLQLLRFEVVNDSTYVQHDSLAVLDLSDDTYIVNFISAGCDFCRLGANKLSMIIDHNNIDKRHLKFLVWGYDADIVKFMDDTNTRGYEFWFLNPIKSLNITYGKFPTYVWFDHGNIISSGDLRDLDEGKIVKFLR